MNPKEIPAFMAPVTATTGRQLYQLRIPTQMSSVVIRHLTNNKKYSPTEYTSTQVFA
jgi:hypothetical protein